jgi:hypothetical protein
MRYGPEGLHLWSLYRNGTVFIVEQNKAFDPVNVGLFGVDTLVFEEDFMTELIEKLRLVIYLWVDI